MLAFGGEVGCEDDGGAHCHFLMVEGKSGEEPSLPSIPCLQIRPAD